MSATLFFNKINGRIGFMLIMVRLTQYNRIQTHYDKIDTQYDRIDTHYDKIDTHYDRIDKQ